MPPAALTAPEGGTTITTSKPDRLMRNKLRDVLVALAGAAVAAAAFYAATPTEGQAPASRIPRTPDGKPNLNGIWQALNTANYDIQAHMARPALAMRPVR